jgi:hypothetical protein
MRTHCAEIVCAVNMDGSVSDFTAFVWPFAFVVWNEHECMQ